MRKFGGLFFMSLFFSASPSNFGLNSYLSELTYCNAINQFIGFAHFKIAPTYFSNNVACPAVAPNENATRERPGAKLAWVCGASFWYSHRAIP